ncbi:hypothetical protein DL98DRAFT_517275 [Cadophora sp. DSE1049]|nr:hypothetical protein DL98DRAFT_517275 [Cadophora sp. DSE1049]
MASNPSPEAGQMNVTPTIPPWSSSRLASDNRPNSESTLGEVRANTTPALASSSASRPLPTSNAAARLNEAKGTSKMIRLICASSSGKTSTAGHTIADDQEESVKL